MIHIIESKMIGATIPEKRNLLKILHINPCVRFCCTYYVKIRIYGVIIYVVLPGKLSLPISSQVAYWMIQLPDYAQTDCLVPNFGEAWKANLP